ncbi:YczE/YyaS/YitT family protein [Virgisporangium aurantiacum]|uniref:Membrane protein YczE n=1 Tax=Virgisporangium aurantiacum TaxID=175570 RepID=A0A8J3ZH92_9ACTN|nr:hypothetical protein [Virgisporangium aurantiacum]GIJ64097.1 hypothetical protein Vau01_116130 [Virgisporangium aurantiacum]
MSRARWVPAFTARWEGWRRLVRDLVVIQAGFALYGLAIDLLVRSRLGTSSWVVLEAGITNHVPITLGQSVIAVSVLLILVVVPCREPIGWGTLANMIFIGVWVDLWRPLVPATPDELTPGALTVRLSYLALAVLTMGFATGIYVGVRAGAGPRDSLMLAVARLAGISVRLSRTLIEVTVVALGWLLGGPVGVGTVVFAVTIGPSVQFAFRVLHVEPDPRRPAGSHRRTGSG